jgi:hypothetical protein
VGSEEDFSEDAPYSWGAEIMCIILLKCSETNNLRKKFAINKSFCLNENLSYEKILNFMSVMELKI